MEIDWKNPPILKRKKPYDVSERDYKLRKPKRKHKKRHSRK